jgi:hypothetical protein
MFDQGGLFMLLIARSGLPKFAANKRDAGNPEGEQGSTGWLARLYRNSLGE